MGSRYGIQQAKIASTRFGVPAIHLNVTPLHWHLNIPMGAMRSELMNEECMSKARWIFLV